MLTFIGKSTQQAYNKMYNSERIEFTTIAFRPFTKQTRQIKYN